MNQITDLPPDVQASDLEFPKKHLPWEQLEALGLGGSALTFYLVPSLGGWILTTLGISGAGRQATARSYGIGLDGKTCRVGKGPHVKASVTIYLSADNVERLSKYVELWQAGMERAGEVRDRISSRRAQGQIHRANGRTRWTW